MITTRTERALVVALIEALDENIVECGRCDHSVGICVCHLTELRESANYLLTHNHLTIREGDVMQDYQPNTHVKSGVLAHLRDIVLVVIGLVIGLCLLIVVMA